MAVQARHVRIDDLGVQIEVQGDRARLVPVLAEWEQPLATPGWGAVTLTPHTFLIRDVSQAYRGR